MSFARKWNSEMGRDGNGPWPILISLKLWDITLFKPDSTCITNPLLMSNDWGLCAFLAHESLSNWGLLQLTAPLWWARIVKVLRTKKRAHQSHEDRDCWINRILQSTTVYSVTMVLWCHNSEPQVKRKSMFETWNMIGQHSGYESPKIDPKLSSSWGHQTKKSWTVHFCSHVFVTVHMHGYMASLSTSMAAWWCHPFHWVLRPHRDPWELQQLGVDPWPPEHCCQTRRPVAIGQRVKGWQGMSGLTNIFTV